MDTAFEPVIPSEGLHVLHLFYRIEHGAWRDLGREDQLAARTDFAAIIQEIRATPDVQIVTLGMVTPKSDLGIMLVGPDLQLLHGFEKRLALSLGPDILTPVYSYLSMTERSEYTTSDEEYAAELQGEKGARPGQSRVCRSAGGVPRAHGKVFQAPPVSGTARLARALFLSHEQTPRARAELVCARFRNAE